MTRSKSALQVIDYRLRRTGLSGVRLMSWLVSNRWSKPVYCGNGNGHKIAELVVPITRTDGFAHPALEQGKHRNLELAVPYFDGLLVTPQSTLSFWRVLGRVSQKRGFTWGMELRGGCVTPAIGGGLCLLSNAIFELAVRSGWKIIERHGHSLEAVPPVAGTVPLDATVAWPDVDLVVAPARGWARLAVTVTPNDELCLVVFAEEAAPRTELEANEQVVHRDGQRYREIEVIRSVDGVREVVAHTVRRILSDDELGKTCLSCNERSCRDRPKESVLSALRKTT